MFNWDGKVIFLQAQKWMAVSLRAVQMRALFNHSPLLIGGKTTPTIFAYLNRNASGNVNSKPK